MKKKQRIAAAAVAALSFSLPTLAQTTTTAPPPSSSAGASSTGGMTMPYQQSFWGYVGGNIGESKYNAGCPVGNCNGDWKDTTYKIYGGGKFNNMFGLEIGYIDMGEPDIGSNSKISARGLNFSGTAGVPIGANSSVFAKFGGLWGRTKLTSPSTTVSTGKTDGWGWSGGIGALIGFTPNWGVRLDLDRYQFKFASTGHDTVDTATVGLQYNFR